MLTSRKDCQYYLSRFFMRILKISTTRDSCHYQRDGSKLSDIVVHMYYNVNKFRKSLLSISLYGWMFITQSRMANYIGYFLPRKISSSIIIRQVKNFFVAVYQH